jgi:hypothetical protein
MTDAESVTTIIGASAINWAYGTSIQAAGFASAMKFRDRSNKGRKGRSRTSGR